MPRIATIQTNFTAGEFSPRMGSRVDIDRYRNAARSLENVKIRVQGGVERADGLRYIATQKTIGQRPTLIPYVFNKSQRFMLEIGQGYVRFYDNNGQVLSAGVPYEIAAPWVESALPDLDYCQGADTMFIFHEDYPVYRLRRYGATNWVLEPVPWIVQPVDEIGYTPSAAALSISDPSVGAGRTFSAGAATFLAADVGRTISASGGLGTITAVTTPTTATVTIITAFPTNFFNFNAWTINGSPQSTVTPGVATPEGIITTLTASSATFRPSDVGGFIDLNGGTVQIISYTSATSVQVSITAVMTAAAASPPNAWVLKLPVWGGANGYPSTGTLYQQRLWCGGSKGAPQSMWASVIGQYLDFTLGSDDTDGLSFTLSSDQLNPIQHMTQLRALVVLTSGGEFTVKGGSDNPITPTNIQVFPQSNYGCNDVSPERVANEMMFVQRAGAKIRGMSADKINTDEYGSPDITVLNDTVGESPITMLAYAMEPVSTLHAVRDDGLMYDCVIDRDQDVVGWTHRTTDGLFEAVASMPNDNGDEVWAIVNRSINGQATRYIEKFDPAIMTDCAFTGTSASPSGDTVWTGLSPLNGKTVVVKGDGVHLNDQLVVGGQITVERPVKSIEIGIKYVPKINLLNPEVVMADGTSQIANIGISKMSLRVLNTIGGYINGQPLVGRKLVSNALDQPPVAYSGDVPIETLGWQIGDFTIEITQPQPYPINLLGVITIMTSNK
jgi:hypothetical protein